VLADHAPAAAVELFVERLPRVGYSTQQRLIAALATIARQQGPEFCDQVLPLMASAEESTRSAVIKILLGMRDRVQVVKRYLIFSKTLAGWARDRALDSMRAFGEGLLDPVLELMSDSDDDVRSLAIVVASSFADPRVVPAAVSLLGDEDWWIRITAADTLGNLNDRRAVPALIESLGDPEVRWAAVEALGRIGDPTSLRALARLLEDPAPEVRIEVLLALKRFEGSGILDLMQKVATTDPSRAVRMRALEFAAELAQRSAVHEKPSQQLRVEALKIDLGAGERRMNQLLVATRNRGASDLHIAVSEPPLMRVAAELVRTDEAPLTAEQTRRMLREIVTDEQWAKLEERQYLDFCYYIPDAGRYRGNIFLDRLGSQGVFRVIPEEPPTIADIGLPPQLAGLADYHQGLVLVCGPGGSGKSTTVAAFVNLFNETRSGHILSLEDPVEIVHPFKHCLINQREVGSDTRSYARALRGALREDPDVIVIGELRDRETMAQSLVAAETGHVVLATLNSTSAPKAVDRIIAGFPVDQQAQVRTSLSESLAYVIAQRLLPSKRIDRQVACFEILKGTLGVGNLIRDDKTYQLQSTLQLGREQGMQSFDDALRDLVRRDLIHGETAYMAAQKREDFEAMVSAEFLAKSTLF
jgi:twitching motility protein PilT